MVRPLHSKSWRLFSFQGVHDPSSSAPRFRGGRRAHRHGRRHRNFRGWHISAIGFPPAKRPSPTWCRRRVTSPRKLSHRARPGLYRSREFYRPKRLREGARVALLTSAKPHGADFMNSVGDEKYLRQAIVLAKRSPTNGCHPFGTVIVSDADCILAAYESRNERGGDATEHSELSAVRLASSAYSKDVPARSTRCPAASFSFAVSAASRWWDRSRAEGGRRAYGPLSAAEAGRT
jgi:hypothetical protein